MKSNINCQGSRYGYQGRVKIHVQKLGKTLATYTYTNAGLPKFFQELCTFLAGQGNVRDLLPASIALYSLNTGLLEQNAGINSGTLDKATLWQQYWQNGADRLGHSYIQTVLQPVTLETVFTTNTGNGTETSTVCQVSIPYTSFAKTSQDVHLMALYPRRINYAAPQDSALAFYELKDLSGAWKPLNINGANADLNLLIEWQLNFSNL